MSCGCRDPSFLFLSMRADEEKGNDKDEQRAEDLVNQHNRAVHE